MKLIRLGFLAIVLLSMGVGSAFADHNVGSDVPGALIVVNGGLEWAHANPCPPGGCPSGNGILLGALPFGWAVASAADFLASSWGSNGDVEADFAGRCAASYFDDNFDYDHCDGLVSNDIYNSPWNVGGGHGFEETLVVRAAGVPEPTTLILLGTGLAALLAARKRSA